MTRNGKRNRAKFARIRNCVLDGQPWAIIPSAMTDLVEAIADKDLGAIYSILIEPDDQPEEETPANVAVIPVTGVLREESDDMVAFGLASSYIDIENQLREAVADDSIKAIVMFMDTPGGSAIGVKRVADTIHEYRGSKPIVAYSQTVCGSAGYYIAAACDSLVGTADSLWGSIGTIYNHVDMSKMLDEAGYKVTVITNKRSPLKGLGNAYEPLSDEGRKQIGDFIDSYGEGFISDVARYRGTTDAEVVNKYGGGDVFRADKAIENGMLDRIVSGFGAAIQQIMGGGNGPSLCSLTPKGNHEMKFSEKLRAQLFALDLIPAVDASDEVCEAAVAVFFKARGIDAPSDENEIASAIRVLHFSNDAGSDEPSDEEVSDDESSDDETESTDETETTDQPESKAFRLRKAHRREQSEARLAELQATARLVNSAVGSEKVTASMILEAATKKWSNETAMNNWSKSFGEAAAPNARVTGSGRDNFAADAIDAMLYRSSYSNDIGSLSAGAQSLVNKPLWAVAGQCLELAGEPVDIYGNREQIAESAMSMGDSTRRRTMFSANEDRRYVNAAGPYNRPGDFPNILSGLANKFLDTVQLDDDYAYEKVSALLPGGLNDFKPGLMINKGVVEELDELSDAEQLKELGVAEEVLSYIYLRRFGNKFGWTPVMVANDDMNAFAEGMLGMAEAWKVTQNRLVIDRYTTTETLLDGSALFANRADTGTGSNPATNNNNKTSGGAPSDAEWASMEVLYADIGGIETGRRVRGTLNVCFVPTGARLQEARRTFEPLAGLEPKAAATTANVGLYRNGIDIVADSELRVASTTTWYGLRNPTNLNTATVVRAYFNGYGTGGKRETWYDPTNKTSYVSLEGRMAVATKNWRYAVRNVA